MNGEGISDGLSAERKVEIRVRKNGRKDKVIVEKSAAQGLPEGWIKKLEITNRSGRKTRRDPVCTLYSLCDNIIFDQKYILCLFHISSL
jgi:hypothetical protein